MQCLNVSAFQEQTLISMGRAAIESSEDLYIESGKVGMTRDIE